MDPLDQVLGQCPTVAALRDQARRLCRQHTGSRRMPTVLILGETGTGKGLLARALHQASPRADGPFVAINCAAIPETLLEAEMFGYERGAFTDARQAKPGLFQTAHHGTIFLDEVSLLAEGLQTKLLKAIEEREVRRLGATRSEAVDVWIITAASGDLHVAYRARRFNEALYHRLAVVTFHCPPLRERGRDIDLLARQFLAQTCRDYGLQPKTLTPEAEAVMRTHPWPGNVRELANAVERAVLLSDGDHVTAASLGLELAVKDREASAKPGAQRLSDAMETLELQQIQAALTETGWNVSHAAILLGMPRNTLDYRIAKYKLRPLETRRRRSRRAAKSAPPEALAERPSAADAHVRWERRHVGFVQVVLRSAESPPGSYAATLLNELVEKVKGFGGQVEEISPTGLIAAFGLEPSEDASARAAQAALAIRSAGERASSVAPALGLSIGVHGGAVMTGRVDGGWHIAAEDKRSALMVLNALVEPIDSNQIAVSPGAARLVVRRFALDDISPRDHPSALRYRLVGLEPTGLGLGGRPLSRLVGRAPEMDAVHSRLREVAQGLGRAIGIMGEPGIGKSRLLYEIRQAVVKRGLTYLEGHCVEYRRTTPYGPMLEILRLLCGLADGDPVGGAAEKVRAALETAGLDADTAAPFLLHALGASEASDRLALLAPETIRRGTFDALRHFVLAQARAHPVILAIEDLHWFDATSEAFLDSFVDSLAGVPLLMLATYRSGHRPRWLDKSYAMQLTLSPLATADGRMIVDAILGQPEPSDTLASAIVERADGNPFFLEELAWTVADDAERGTSGRTIPDTVQATLLARITRLPDKARTLLQTAAVLGRHCPTRLLSALWTDEESLSGAIAELQRLEFLYERPGPDGADYVFKHGLTQEVAYASLAPDHRRALHGRVVDSIERESRSGLAQYVERLAHHAFHAERWGSAVTYLRQAAGRAADRCAFWEAAASWEQALEALGHLPENRETLEQAVDIRLELRRARFSLARFRDDLEAAQQAEQFAKILGDVARQARACGLAANRLVWVGEYDQATASAGRALTLSEAANDRAARAQADLILALAQYARGEYSSAIDALRPKIPAIHATLESIHDAATLPSVLGRYAFDVRAFLNNSYVVLASCLAERGEFAEAERNAEEARRIAEGGQHLADVTLAAWAAGQIAVRRGAVPLQTLALLERARLLYQDTGVSTYLAWTDSLLAYARLLTGLHSEAIALLEQALEHAAAHGLFFGRTLWLT